MLTYNLILFVNKNYTEPPDFSSLQLVEETLACIKACNKFRQVEGDISYKVNLFKFLDLLIQRCSHFQLEKDLNFILTEIVPLVFIESLVTQKLYNALFSHSEVYGSLKNIFEFLEKLEIDSNQDLGLLSYHNLANILNQQNWGQYTSILKSNAWHFLYCYELVANLRESLADNNSSKISSLLKPLNLETLHSREIFSIICRNESKVINLIQLALNSNSINDVTKNSLKKILYTIIKTISYLNIPFTTFFPVENQILEEINYIKTNYKSFIINYLIHRDILKIHENSTFSSMYYSSSLKISNILIGGDKNIIHFLSSNDQPVYSWQCLLECTLFYVANSISNEAYLFKELEKGNFDLFVFPPLPVPNELMQWIDNRDTDRCYSIIIQSLVLNLKSIDILFKIELQVLATKTLTSIEFPVVEMRFMRFLSTLFAFKIIIIDCKNKTLKSIGESIFNETLNDFLCYKFDESIISPISYLCSLANKLAFKSVKFILIWESIIYEIITNNVFAKIRSNLENLTVLNDSFQAIDPRRNLFQKFYHEYQFQLERVSEYSKN